MASNCQTLTSIYEVVKTKGGCRRKDIVAVTGLSGACVNINVRNMIQAGALYEIGHVVYPLYKQAIVFMWNDRLVGGKKYQTTSKVDLDAVRSRVVGMNS